MGWKPAKEERYWYLERFEKIESAVWIPTYTDMKRLESGNLFVSFEEARKVRDEIRRRITENPIFQ